MQKNLPIKLLNILLFLCVFCLLMVLINNFLLTKTVYAGEETKEIIRENFDGNTLDTSYWKKFQAGDNTQLVGEDNSFIGLNAINVTGGTGIVGNEIFSNGVKLEIQLKKYIPATNGGWLAFLFGSNISNGDFIDYANINTGKTIFITKTDIGWYMLSHSAEDLDFKDENNNLLSFTGEYPRSYKLSKLGSVNALENMVITICYQSNNFEFSIRQSEQSFLEREILFKTENLPFFSGRAGIAFAGANGEYCNAEIENIKLYNCNNEDFSSEPQISFNLESSNPLNDFIVNISTQNKGGFYFGQQSNLGFKKESNKDSYVVYKVPSILDQKVTKDNFIFKTTFRIKQIEGNANIGIVLGAKDYFTNFNTSGNTYLYFGKDNDNLFLKAIKYKDNGNETIIEKQNLSIDYSEFDFKLVINHTKGTDIYINDVFFGTFNEVSFAGYFGFACTNNDNTLNYVDVGIDNIYGSNRIYSSTPKVDISANFDNDEVNIREWYFPELAGNIRDKSTGVYVENGVLNFDEVNSNGAITSIPTYSNFELKFDITDIQREPIYDLDGKIVLPASSWIGIMYGIDYDYKINFSYLLNVKKCPLITFVSNTQDGVIPQNNQTYVRLHNVSDEVLYWCLPTKYNIFDLSAKDKIVNIKTTMVDGILTLEIKYSNETDWYQVFSVNTISALVGNVSIRGYGEGEKLISSSFKIDNISIINKDVNPIAPIDYGFESNKIKTISDYDYNPILNTDSLIQGEKLASSIEEKTEGCSSSLLGVLQYTMIPICLALIIIIKRRANEK